jgi:HEAT repeat protein
MERLVLKENVSREDVDQAARTLDWLWWEDVERTGESPHETIWVTPDHESRVHYIEDFLVGVNYLLFEGPRAGELARGALEVPTLSVYTHDELIALGRQADSRDDLIHAVYLAGVDGVPGHLDDDLVEIFRKCFASADPDVRHAAIAATGYVGWPQLIEELERLAASDPDEGVRGDAQLMLDALREHPPEEA